MTMFSSRRQYTTHSLCQRICTHHISKNSFLIRRSRLCTKLQWEHISISCTSTMERSTSGGARKCFCIAWPFKRKECKWFILRNETFHLHPDRLYQIRQSLTWLPIAKFRQMEWKKTRQLVRIQSLPNSKLDGFALVRGTGVASELCLEALSSTHADLQEATESVRRSCLTKDRARRGYSLYSHYWAIEKEHDTKRPKRSGTSIL